MWSSVRRDDELIVDLADTFDAARELRNSPECLGVGHLPAQRHAIAVDFDIDAGTDRRTHARLELLLVRIHRTKAFARLLHLLGRRPPRAIRFGNGLARDLVVRFRHCSSLTSRSRRGSK